MCSLCATLCMSLCPSCPITISSASPSSYANGRFPDLVQKQLKAYQCTFIAVCLAIGKGRTKRRSHCRNFHAVAQDHHSEVVSRWIDELVVGQGFCPWAAPAKSAGHIRVVSSEAATEEGVIADLLAEARQLPRRNLPEHDSTTDSDRCRGPTTVVLVCPKVRSWQAGWRGFQNFARFFELRLQGGQAWVQSEGVRVVSFHPDYTRCTILKPNQAIEVVLPDGQSTRARVLRLAGFDARGALVEVQPEAEEGILTVQLPGAGSEELKASRWKDLALRAPRPALHLLRQKDLDQAFVDLGERMFTDAIFVRNERIARELGAAWSQEMLRRCEDGTVEPKQLLTDQNVKLSGEVFWCDRDRISAGLLEAEGLTVRCFETPEHLLEVCDDLRLVCQMVQESPSVFLQRPSNVLGVLTSMMERDGRKNSRKMNAFDLFAAVRPRGEEQRLPVLGLISLSADRDEAIAAGADFVVYGDRLRAQQQMLRHLRNRLGQAKIERV
eukprot:s823_g10.t1